MTTTSDAMVRLARSHVRALDAAHVQAHLIAGDVALVDLRETEEREEHGAIPGTIHVPRGVLEFRADPASPLHRAELDPSRPTVLLCGDGSRSALAGEVLMSLGYRDVTYLDGGIQAWKRAGFPVAGLEPWQRPQGSLGRSTPDGSAR